MALEACSLGSRRVPRTDPDDRHRDGCAQRGRRLTDAHQRRTQVAFDVDGQRLERRHIQHAAALPRGRHRLEHQPVETPQKRRECFARSRGGQNQRGFARTDRGPAARLRGGRSVKDGREPLPDRGFKLRQGHLSMLSRSFSCAMVHPAQPRGGPSSRVPRPTAATGRDVGHQT